MLPLNDLKTWVRRQGLQRYEQLMLVIASLGGGPVSLNEIRQQAEKAGWKIPTGWNSSDILGKTNGLAVKTHEGWELTEPGKEHLRKLGAPIDASAALQVAHDLRSELDKIKNPDTRAFADEAVECFERGLWRSAIVMSWIGALHLLYDHVLNNKLLDFNKEAKRINQKHKDATNIDELAKCMGESDFLDRLENISVISNSIKKELKECLDRRNSSGHPNSYKPLKNTVAHHLEILLVNIYKPFSK